MSAHRWPVLIVVAALALAPLVLPISYVTPLNYIGLYTIVCIGLVLLTGVAGLTSFGQAAFVGLGAYTSAVLTTSYGWSPWATLPVALVNTGIVALALGWLTIRLAGHYLVLGTLAWGIGLFYVFGNLPGLGGYNGISGLPPNHERLVSERILPKPYEARLGFGSPRAAAAVGGRGSR